MQYQSHNLAGPPAFIHKHYVTVNIWRSGLPALLTDKIPMTSSFDKILTQKSLATISSPWFTLWEPLIYLGDLDAFCLQIIILADLSGIASLNFVAFLQSWREIDLDTITSFTISCGFPCPIVNNKGIQEFQKGNPGVLPHGAVASLIVLLYGDKFYL